jgi:FMN phosphatase YigB (HAD superfamily)
MTIRVITFDLDNTLWDVEPALLRAEEAQRRGCSNTVPGAMDDIGHDELWALKKRLWKPTRSWRTTYPGCANCCCASCSVQRLR